MRERDFLAWIIACAEQFGWLVKHIPAPMVATRGGGFVGARRGAGVPDLIMLHDDPPRLIFAEVKGDGGKLSDAQREFLQAARNVAETSIATTEWTQMYGEHDKPVGVYAWTPADQDLIEQILRSRSLI